MSRRSSYAQVASGGNSHTNSVPARLGGFSHPSSSGAHSHAIAHPRHHSRTHDDGQHNAMSTSLGRSGPLPSYSSQFGYLKDYTRHDGSESTFFVPSYLRGSKHAEKLEEVHRARMAAQREYRSAHSSNAGSLSTSSSSANLYKMPSSHRGMTHEIVERPPALAEEPIAPWPTRWNETDKFPQMEVEENGRLAKFAGAQKSHDEAASIRADYPMPRQCGIYYYEVTVVSKGKDGRMIGVGFSGPKVSLNRIPGWEPDSYAYHGDDGQCFSNTTSGKPYGPKFGTLDVIGCGINFRTNTAFFTKNGHYLDTAFRDLKPGVQYYPTVGMKKQNEMLKANFGQEPFAFDIDKMVQDEKAAIQAEITRFKESVTFNESDMIQSLVAQYLAHDGYVESARAFAEETSAESRALANEGSASSAYIGTEEDIHAINRQKIRAAILDGDIDKALKHTNTHYANVLRDNENIYFKLRCRKFIEMIRQCSELNAQRYGGNSIPTPPSKRSTTTAIHTNNSTATKRSSTATEEYDFEMELDEQLGVHNGAPWDTPADEEDEDDDEEDEDEEDGADREEEDDDEDETEAQAREMTARMLQYGMELRSEFANDQRREVKKALEDTFALVAYENVRESSLAPLLDPAGRVPVAEELNGAILVSLGKSSSAVLERLVQQTEALVNELAEDGGSGAFINVRRDFLQ
ncbi:Ran-binding protein-like protein [Periconia macrospinosa]|uniref:Ran-binding protein-like protein n=1 Tax=Periconia macrospinosa TaxID=97972 RepID=A0A2V1EFW3_9PLEO|nr:Ran-binding protein-like protein [Periconia macrospinosa]